MTAILTIAQAKTGAQALGLANMRKAGRVDLTPEDKQVGNRAYRRFLLLVPVEHGGYLGRSQQWLLSAEANTGCTEQDLSDAMWGRIEEEFRATFAMRADERLEAAE